MPRIRRQRPDRGFVSSRSDFPAAKADTRTRKDVGESILAAIRSEVDVKG